MRGVQHDDEDTGGGAVSEERTPPEEADLVGPDWAWRRRVRDHGTWYPVYRVVIFLVGLVLVLGGLALVPLPGPGWLIVIIGLAIWASEFDPAQRLLEFVKDKVRAWEEWMRRQSVLVRVAVTLVTFAFVLGVVWATLWVIGVPGFLPEAMAGWLRLHAGL